MSVLRFGEFIAESRQHKHIQHFDIEDNAFLIEGVIYLMTVTVEVTFVVDTTGAWDDYSFEIDQLLNVERVDNESSKDYSQLIELDLFNDNELSLMTWDTINDGTLIEIDDESELNELLEKVRSLYASGKLRNLIGNGTSLDKAVEVRAENDYEAPTDFGRDSDDEYENYRDRNDED